MGRNVKRIAILFLAVCLFLGSVPLSTMAVEIKKDRSTPSGIAYDSIPEEVDRFIAERSEGLAACSVAVLDGSQTLYKQHYGMANMENNVPADETTVYEWGSISKLLVWVSVMQLQEEGRLNLDTEVAEYLPKDFLTKRKYSEKMTMLNLMNHNAGFQETTYAIEVQNTDDIVPLEQALRASEPCQVYRPGEITAYSNWGASLAAFIVEQISGVSYGQYVKENILDPLGMNHTSIKADCSDNLWVQKQRQLLKCYSITLDSQESFGNCISYILLYPAGSAAGTMEDLMKFAKAFTEENEISPFFKNENTLTIMLSASSYYGKPEATSGLERNFHGLWAMEYATRVKGHAGNTSGCSANLLFDDITGLTVLVMTNEMGESAFCYGIPGLLFGQYAKEENVLPAVHEDIHGIYQSMRTIQKGFLRFNGYIGNLFPISKTEDEDTYKLSIGEGTLSKASDEIYLYDNGNGMQNIQYLYRNEKGEVYLQQFTSDYKLASPISFWLHIALLAAFILSVIIAIVTSLVLILTWLIRKLKRAKELDINKYENTVIWLYRASLLAIVSIGVLCWQYLIKPLDGGELIRSQVAWKCILNGILSLVPLGFAIVLSFYWKQIKTHRKCYVFFSVIGLIVSFNFWYWDWYNFIC